MKKKYKAKQIKVRFKEEEEKKTLTFLNPVFILACKKKLQSSTGLIMCNLAISVFTNILNILEIRLLLIL